VPRRHGVAQYGSARLGSARLGSVAQPRAGTQNATVRVPGNTQGVGVGLGPGSANEGLAIRGRTPSRPANRGAPLARGY